MPFRSGWNNPAQQKTISDLVRVSGSQEVQGRMITTPITNLQAVPDATTNGAQVSFTVLSLLGISSFVLLRNFSRDPGSAKQLNVWTAQSMLGRTLPTTITYTDADQSIAGQQVYYWIRVVPGSNPLTGAILVGPQLMSAAADPGAPNPIADFSISHGASSGGQIMVSVAIKPPANDPRWSSTQILVAGYNGVAARVAIAQAEGKTFSFPMLATGETPVFTAIAVSSTGKIATSGPTVALTLNVALTVPAKIMNAVALELGQSGVQISWPNGPEPTLTQFALYRGPKGAGFGAATLLVNPAWSSTTAVFNYLDVAGLTGAFEWYVLAQNAAGTSTPSAAIQTNALNTTADLTLNNAACTPTTQPLAAATGGSANHATINVASFVVQYPFGTVNYNSGSITPLLDNTQYYVYTDDPTYAGGARVYAASTAVPNVTANENRLYLGTITTPVFGGGATGGHGGGGGPCFTGNTLVKTQDGAKPIQDIRIGDQVQSLAGWIRVKATLKHWYEGPMHAMGFGEFVTPEHRLWSDREWVAAKELWPDATPFKGWVFNLHCAGCDDFERCYRLKNGSMAHNQQNK